MRSTCLIAMLALPLFGQPALPAPPATSVRMFAGPAAGSYLGIGIQEMTAERAKELKLRREAGVEITRVSPESPAEKAGLKVGDVVLQYNGTKVEGIEQLQRLVRETPAGREAKVEISRSGSNQMINVRIGQRPPAPGVPEFFNQRMPDVPRIFSGLRSPMLGVEAEPLEGQLAQYFGVSDGVLVRSVAKGSLAEKAGIKAGDVIQRVDDTKVATPADITGRLRTARGKAVVLSIVRDHKETSVSVDVPDPRVGRAEPARIVSADEP
jgi:serine protease Do